MTKKHFIAAAEIVRMADLKEVETLMRGFVQLFQQFNPRFSRERFEEACKIRSA